MTYKDEDSLLGITIVMKPPHRNSGGGNKEGRHGRRSQQADVTKAGKTETVKGGSYLILCKNIRDKFDLPESARIKKTGRTEL